MKTVYAAKPYGSQWLAQAWRLGRAGRIALLTMAVLIAAGNAEARGRTLLWKPVPQALFKENNRPVKTWNIYQPDNDRNLVLVQVNREWFILNLKQKRVYQASRSDFQARGESLAGPAPDRRTAVVKTDDWDSHDIGPAQQISVRIIASRNVLAIELPHPLAIY